MIEKKLAQDALKEKTPKKGGAKLSDIPVVGEKLRALDPYVPSLLVSTLFFNLTVLFLFFNIVIDTWYSVRQSLISTTFRPRMFSYDGPRPAEKEFAFSDAVSIADIKRVQKAFTRRGRHITLNDVMCAVVAKTIDSYVKEVGQTPDSR